jgi:hypothetical protein
MFSTRYQNHENILRTTVVKYIAGCRAMFGKIWPIIYTSFFGTSLQRLIRFCVLCLLVLKEEKRLTQLDEIKITFMATLHNVAQSEDVNRK